MKLPYTFYRYTKTQRKGILSLFIVIILIQIVYFIAISQQGDKITYTAQEEKEWLALQEVIDSIKVEKSKGKQYKIYPFNPNYITDYKGYVLGMTPEEIYRLHKFRATNKYVNTPEDFQNVTKVSDSLLASISPYFKFPDWVNKKYGNKSGKNTKIYPFNPNYISNYKAELIGLSKTELKRLREFRKTNQYINTPEDFQRVTKISDSRLAAISPYFKFPDWVVEKYGKGAKNKKVEIYPFNPNYISDYKAKLIGLSKVELNRIRKFRETGKYINSPEDFQNVTKVSDSLLNAISPYFKFPDWVVAKNKVMKAVKNGKRIDINTATQEELKVVYGIGPMFSERILKKKKKLGAYVNMEQLDEFEEFSPRAKKELHEMFEVKENPKVKKVNINAASLNVLADFPYFNNDIAQAIVIKREQQGKIKNVEELIEINGFPVEKLKIIALYLEF